MSGPESADSGAEGSEPTMQAVADCLRAARYEINQLRTTIVAFGNFDRWAESLERDHAHATRTMKWVDEMLAKLPPPTPMTPEQMQATANVVRVALDKREGEATEDDMRAAFQAWVNVGGHQ